MVKFAHIYAVILQATSHSQIVQQIVSYLKEAKDEDKLAAIQLFVGNRPKRIITTASLKTLLLEKSDIPEWLFDYSHEVGSDLAETCALILPFPKHESSDTLAAWMRKIKALAGEEDYIVLPKLWEYWDQLNQDARLVLNKLVTGGFRLNIERSQLLEALELYTQIDRATLAQLLNELTDTEETSFEEHFNVDENPISRIQPFPFIKTRESPAAEFNLDALANFEFERDWEGIRCHLIKKDDKMFIWSEEGDMILDKFPELLSLEEQLPHNIILDGLIISLPKDLPLPKRILRQRLNRKSPSKQLQKEAPATFLAIDLLQMEKIDIRKEPLYLRREKAEQLVLKLNLPKRLIFSDAIEIPDKEAFDKERNESRKYHCQGIIAKNRNDPYHDKTDWIKVKADPMRAKMVLIYATRSQVVRSSHYNEFTFAVSNGDQLISVAKLIQNLEEAEAERIGNFIKENTIEKFGPVRSVKPMLVYEISFQTIEASNRHKSGVMLTGAEIEKPLADLTTTEIDEIGYLLSLIA